MTGNGTLLDIEHCRIRDLDSIGRHGLVEMADSKDLQA